SLKFNPATGTWWRITAGGNFDTGIPGNGTSTGGLPTLTQNPDYIRAQIAKTNTEIAQAQVAQNWLVKKQLFEEAQGLDDQATKTRQQVIDLGTKIGQLAQNPIDYGQAAAVSLANSGWGVANRTPLITNQSLMPLQGLLDQRT